jgi:hypothetical protein
MLTESRFAEIRNRAASGTPTNTLFFFIPPHNPSAPTRVGAPPVETLKTLRKKKQPAYRRQERRLSGGSEDLEPLSLDAALLAETMLFSSKVSRARSQLSQRATILPPPPHAPARPLPRRQKRTRGSRAGAFCPVSSSSSRRHCAAWLCPWSERTSMNRFFAATASRRLRTRLPPSESLPPSVEVR